MTSKIDLAKLEKAASEARNYLERISKEIKDEKVLTSLSKASNSLTALLQLINAGDITKSSVKAYEVSAALKLIKEIEANAIIKRFAEEALKIYKESMANKFLG